MAHEPQHEWDVMMKKVAAFHHKHDFEANNGHDMGYRIALTVEELGEFAAAVTKGKPVGGLRRRNGRCDAVDDGACCCHGD